MLPPTHPRPRIREIVLFGLLALWIAAVLHVEPTAPLTPPAVPYGRPSQ